MFDNDNEIHVFIGKVLHKCEYLLISINTVVLINYQKKGYFSVIY